MNLSDILENLNKEYAGVMQLADIRSSKLWFWGASPLTCTVFYIKEFECLRKGNIDDTNEVPAPDIVYPTYDWHFRYTEQRNTDNPFEITYCIDLLQELSDGKAILNTENVSTGNAIIRLKIQKNLPLKNLTLK